MGPFIAEIAQIANAERQDQFGKIVNFSLESKTKTAFHSTK
jgi:hypothetical protein